MKGDAIKSKSPVKVDDKKIKLEQEKWRQGILECEKRQHQIDREKWKMREQQLEQHHTTLQKFYSNSTVRMGSNFWVSEGYISRYI